MKVAVVGGGVIGLSVAWRCAQRGLAVTVHDPGPTRAAANVAAGMLAPVTELHYGEEQLLALNLDSAGRWPNFAAELGEAAGTDPGYRSTGTLAVARDDDAVVALDALRAYQEELGLVVRRLNAREARSLEPSLARTVRGAIHVPGDHQVESRRLLAALRAAVTKSGGRLVSEAPGGPDELAAMSADVVVVAAGWRSVELVPSLPVRPVKGQILRLGDTDRAVLPTHVLRSGGVYVVPRFGEIAVGATTEDVGPDTTVTAGAVADLLRHAWELVPGIEVAPLVECAAGLRPCTPDNAPIIGALDDRTIVATGHHRNGMLLAPTTAVAVAELVEHGTVPAAVASFGLDRFAHREVPR